MKFYFFMISIKNMVKQGDSKNIPSFFFNIIENY